MRKVIIFDIDGTLLEGGLHEEENAYLRAFDVCYGIRGLSSDWDSYRSHTDTGICREILDKHLNRPSQESDVKRIIGTYELLLNRDVYGKGIPPRLIPGIKDILEILNKRADTGLALSTGNAARISKLRLDKSNIWHYFGCGAFAEDGADKTLILSKALTVCRENWRDFTRTEDAIFVGDHPGDAIAAQALGIHFIGIGDQPGRFPGLVGDQIHPDYRDINGFLEHLERLWSAR